MIRIVAGTALIGIALTDVFLTVVNYDGFSFLASRFHRWTWSATRVLTCRLPEAPRNAIRTLTGPAMLPATVALWLALTVLGFALLYHEGMLGGSFAFTTGTASFGQAVYLSGTAISTLGFGDVTPDTFPYQALAVGQAVVGFAILTSTITYLLATFNVAESLARMADTLRHHRTDPSDPRTLIVPLLAVEDPAGARSLFQQLHGGVQAFDEGLRRYPIVYFFHTRRIERSIVFVFDSLGEIISTLRFATPSGLAVHNDPWLLALDNAYMSAVDRIGRSFLRPDGGDDPEPLSRSTFADAYRHPGRDPWVDQYRHARRAVAAALDGSGARDPGGGGARRSETGDCYPAYRDWFAFSVRRARFLAKTSADLGYDDRHLPSGAWAVAALR